MKRWGLFFLILFAACAKPGNEIAIGEFGSLTGGTATFGRSTHEGIMLASDEVNLAGGLLGKKIHIYTEDDRSLAEEAKTAVLKLIKQQRVVALIGEVASSRSLAAAPEAQKSQIPMISPASTNPQVTLTGDYIFRACFIDSFQGEAMGHFARENLKLGKVAVLKDIRNDYSVGLADFFTQTFSALGGVISSAQSYSEGDTEFRAQLTSILAKQPDGIFIPGYYTEVGLIARQARELGFKGPLFGGDGWDSEKTIEIGGQAMDGNYFSTHYAGDDPSPLVQNFISKFKTKYGHAPDAMAVLGYDAANILFDAIRRAQSVAGPQIRDALATTKNFQGVSGAITINKYRNAEKRLVILKIENGAFKFADSVLP
ncbi:MAG: ABC transporter substrate-binding protein [Deltaproteobacteria bacterium]|nr:ABC transporter substrate-binding protein [Deltaproteobacteria bacterium]